MPLWSQWTLNDIVNHLIRNFFQHGHTNFSGWLKFMNWWVENLKSSFCTSWSPILRIFDEAFELHKPWRAEPIGHQFTIKGYLNIPTVRPLLMPYFMYFINKLTTNYDQSSPKPMIFRYHQKFPNFFARSLNTTTDFRFFAGDQHPKRKKTTTNQKPQQQDEHRRDVKMRRKVE